MRSFLFTLRDTLRRRWVEATTNMPLFGYRFSDRVQALADPEQVDQIKAKWTAVTSPKASR